MYGYAQVDKWKSGKLGNSKIENCKIGRVSDWKSGNLEKFKSGQVEQLDRQTDRGTE